MSVTTFDGLGLNDKILQALEKLGYQSPTPVQAAVIPLFLAKKDVIALAQTGTGKTASFLLPLIEILSQSHAKARMPRAIIMEPTRELAAQVAQAFDQYAQFYKMSKALLIGGESFTDQEKQLEKGADILIATPGRLLDLQSRGKILLNDIRVFIIDEADRMLDMGFIPDIEKIATLLPVTRQTALLSATMPDPIRKLSEKFLTNPEQLTISPPSSTAKTIKQYVVKVEEKQKRIALRDLISHHKLNTAIIFCNRKKDVDILDQSMKRHKFSSGTLHGNMTQHARNETLQNFKEGKISFLIASDVAARGIDIDDLPCVFNFDVPINPDDYVHRIGRTGRAGKEGLAFMLMSEREDKLFKAIVKSIGQTIEIYPTKNLESLEKIPSSSINTENSKPKRKEFTKRKPHIADTSAPVVGFGDDIPSFMR